MFSADTRIIKKICLAALILTLVFAVFTGAQAATAVFHVTAEKVYIREAPGQDSDYFALVRKDSDLEFLGYEKGWIKVKFNGKIGYVSGDYAALYNVLSSDAKLTAKVTASQLNIRTSPTTDAPSSAKPENGTIVNVLGMSGDWLYVSCNGVTGYAKAEYLKLCNVEGTSSTTSSATVTTTTATTTISRGAKGDSVMQLQKLLISAGYLTGEADGVFGAKTETAVKLFQKASSLTQTGKADPTTLNALTATANTATLLKQGDKGTQIKLLQQNLIALGYLRGEADGIYGSGTKTAVMTFQAASGLTADGQAGIKTLNAIASAVGSISASTSLKFGDRGDAVKALQQKLISLNYLSGNADGIYGSGTEKAVSEFQKKSSLTVTGCADTQTVEKLSAAYNSTVTSGTTITSPSTITSIDASTYPVLKYGDSGSAVETLQSRLNQLGYFNGTVGGNFGALTKTAVIAFQNACGLDADGVVGKDTWTKLYSDSAASAAIPTSTLQYGDRGSEVASMQSRLFDLGYLNTTADGIFGEGTEKALRAFQTASGLTSDGIAGARTMNLLFNTASSGTATTTVSGNPTGSGSVVVIGSNGVRDTDYEKAQQVIALAKKYLGCKYIYAHQEPPYFDCSGLVQYVYKQFGFKLKRTAYEQGYAETYPKIKTIEELQPGDCVYFNTNEKDSDLCDHAGIYIGDGEFIHASSSGMKVQTNNFNTDKFYRTHFSWGRRVLNQN